MGSGDWNDGMNRVGHEGRGESVWLGFFLCEVLRQFAAAGARPRRRAPSRSAATTSAASCAQRLEEHGWDGAWYRRAYFDDGTPLGSADSAECQIDSIAQSWAVLSGVGRRPSGRARRWTRWRRAWCAPRPAWSSCSTRRSTAAGPTRATSRGYVPGVRENGGQYTHGAIWAAMAFAALGDARARLAADGPDQPAAPRPHAPSEVGAYKVEPYVVAADVYSVAPHTGRGGWTWYTGSAGWMYRLVVESLLGLQLQIDERRRAAAARARACRRDWPGYTLDYRFRETVYHLTVEPAAVAGVSVDGVPCAGPAVPLVDDQGTHEVRVRIAHPLHRPPLNRERHCVRSRTDAGAARAQDVEDWKCSHGEEARAGSVVAIPLTSGGVERFPGLQRWPASIAAVPASSGAVGAGFALPAHGDSAWPLHRTTSSNSCPGPTATPAGGVRAGATGAGRGAVRARRRRTRHVYFPVDGVISLVTQIETTRAWRSAWSVAKAWSARADAGREQDAAARPGAGPGHGLARRGADFRRELARSPALRHLLHAIMYVRMSQMALGRPACASTSSGRAWRAGC